MKHIGFILAVLNSVAVAGVDLNGTSIDLCRFCEHRPPPKSRSLAFEVCKRHYPSATIGKQNARQSDRLTFFRKFLEFAVADLLFSEVMRMVGLMLFLF